VAADAERASGYCYGQSTYLVQLKRHGAGIALIDPVALPDLSPVAAAVGGAEWILHAASQDLQGFAEHGIVPATLFDTELAGRLLGLPRVGLASMVAEFLGLGLAKEHSAVDWSRRPLPADWLRYAALDVEVLIELRHAMEERLDAAGKLTWARQEFAAELTAPTPPPRVDPWRRTSGIGSIKNRRTLAIVRELWLARDASARERDIAVGRVLPDKAILAAAGARPRTTAQLIRITEFSGKGQRRRAPYWQEAISTALRLPESALPPVRGPRPDGPPPHRNWGSRKPEAAARLEAARAFVAEESERLAIPVENLLEPDALRRLCWSPPRDVTSNSVASALRSRRAREWQVDLLAAGLAQAIG
jgi:ribonuclease D